MRHVDHNLVAHEEFIGFYHKPNIFSDTIVSVVKDVLNLSQFKCRGQCYDGAGTMAGCRNGVATIFKLILVNPATNAVSERTANIDLDEVASEFASKNDNRKRHFGI